MLVRIKSELLNNNVGIDCIEEMILDTMAL